MIILSKMMYDVSLFLVIFLACSLGFGLAFVAVMSTQPSWQPLAAAAAAKMAGNTHAYGGFAGVGGSKMEEEGTWDVVSAAGIPFWSALGQPPLLDVEETSPWVGTIMLWIYVFAAQLLLINLLIAMMSNTYQKYAVNAEKEFYFNKVASALEAKAFFAVPPPFSLPLLLCSPSAWRPSTLPATAEPTS